MSISVRRALFWSFILLLFLLAAGGLLTVSVYRWIAPTNTLSKATQLASIAVAAELEPSSLAWSADGKYLAAGTGLTPGRRYARGPTKVFIVDVGKQSVVDTLETSGNVDGLAFSPDGKWLAVATGGDAGLGKLAVFAVPEFTAKLKAESDYNLGLSNNGRFADIAWAADGKSLHAIDLAMLIPNLGVKIRRWTVPEFREQPAIPVGDNHRGSPNWALAVAPDGLTLACVVPPAYGGPGAELQLIDLGTGKKIASIKGIRMGYYRAAFTTDGKTVGVFAGTETLSFLQENSEDEILDPDGDPKRRRLAMLWWDAATGKPASPATPHFAVQPAGQADSRTYSIAPDGLLWAHSPMLRIDITNWHNPDIVLTQTNAAKNWYWRAGTGRHILYPSLGFSADGTKLAGILETPTGWTIAIWAVP